MRDGTPGGGSVTDGTFQALAIDNIEMGGGGTGPGNGSPELSTWMLLACSGLAGVVLRRRRKA
jgi:LPXTG-motif cell wall-anchored protein